RWGRGALMPKKTTQTKEITETVDDGKGVIEPELLEPELSPAQSDLAEMFENIGDEVSVVKVKKFVDGIAQWCGNVEPSVLKEQGEAWIQKRFGGGKFQI